MIYLLHGENVSASREALLELKKNYSPDSISVFDAKKFDVDELTRVYETPSFFRIAALLLLKVNSPRQ